jgi:hypothetical protein
MRQAEALALMQQIQSGTLPVRAQLMRKKGSYVLHVVLRPDTPDALSLRAYSTAEWESISEAWRQLV